MVSLPMHFYQIYVFTQPGPEAAVRRRLSKAVSPLISDLSRTLSVVWADVLSRQRTERQLRNGLLQTLDAAKEIL